MNTSLKIVVLAALSCLVAGTATTHAADRKDRNALAKAAMTASFRPSGQAGMDRLDQDDTQAACSRYAPGEPPEKLVARILAVTHATLDQETAIRAAWRAHEDGRRELLAKAPPASIGDPVLDPRELAELDAAFDELLAATLRHEQLARLALEMPPPEPEPDPPAP